jgi:hypothetical protein
MIAATFQKEATKNGNKLLMLVLEPANLEKLRLGQPIVKNLQEFLPELPVAVDLMLSYTPDVLWVAQQLQDGKDLIRAIDASLERPEVFVRPYHLAEELTKREEPPAD